MNDDLEKKIDKSNQIRLETYIRLYDRMILYNLAAQILPKETINDTLDFWDKAIKRHIDDNVQNRTKVLESTNYGRLLQMLHEPDGEDLRLQCLDTWRTAREVIEKGFTQVTDTDEDWKQNDPEDDEV